MKKLLFILSAAILLHSCKKGGEIINTSLMIYISSTDGTDLLDPASDGAIVSPFISIYMVVDGVKTRRHNAENIVKVGDRYTLQIFPDLESARKDRFTYILEYSNREADTITAKIARQGGNISLDDVRINGNPTQRDNIQIIKAE